MAKTSRIAAIFLVSLSVSLLGCAYQGTCRLGECPADREITTNVKSRLDQFPELGFPEPIGVQTHDGVVYLSGLVSHGLQSRTAEQIAENSPGVRRVVNTITVTK